MSKISESLEKQTALFSGNTQNVFLAYLGRKTQ